LPGWGALIEPLALGNLDERETRAFLRARRVASAEHDRILRFTRGHPLALVLVADHLRAHPRLRFRAGQAQKVVQALVKHFVEDLPSEEERTALEACAVARELPEPLLGAMLDRKAARRWFDWLGTLGFIESGPHGHRPHELVRELILEELR